MKTPVIMKLDKERTLRFGNKAIKKIEGLFGDKISKIDFNNLGVEDLEKIIYCGLSGEDPNLDVEKVADLLDEHMEFGEAMEKMKEAFEHAFGSPNAEGVAEKNGTGKK